MVGAARPGRIVVGIHRCCGGSGARATPDAEGIAFRLETGGASGGSLGAGAAAAGGQAKRLVA